MDKAAESSEGVSARPEGTSYESQDYLPPHSEVYFRWLEQQPRSRSWDKWLMMGLIGLSTGARSLNNQLKTLIFETRNYRIIPSPAY